MFDNEELWMKGKGILSGETKWQKEPPDNWKEIPIIAAFMEDNDLQEITVVSTCIGFVRTFQKRLIKSETEKAN